MTQHFADRLYAAIDRKGAPVCAGIDPVFDRLPDDLGKGTGQDNSQAAANAIEQFCTGVLEAVEPHVPCVKFQAACFERYLGPGVAAYHRLIAAARNMDLIVIADAKRGDIGTSSAHYAAAHLGKSKFDDLGEHPGPDALTINGYLGDDAIEPYVKTAAAQGKGLFVLVRTSNPGSDSLQTLRLEDGRSVSDAVADMVVTIGVHHLGACGDSLLGAVVGATKPQDAAQLRERMPQQIFLVPGFGAQGGNADDVRACFKKNGRGALITASRSINYAFEKNDRVDWRMAISQAAAEMNQQIAAVVRDKR